MNGVDGWFALGTALISGGPRETGGPFDPKSERTFDNAVSIRQELREEVRILHANISKLQHELDRWKDRYYDLSARYQTLRLECQALRQSLQELVGNTDLQAFHALQDTIEELRVEPQPCPGK